MDAVDEPSSDISRRDLLGAGSRIGILAALSGTSLSAHAVATGARSTARRPIDCAAGLLHILNNIPLGLAFHLHDADPMHPELFHYFDPARKQGGDNSDALYLGVPVEGSQTYRLYGNRGTAKHLSITTVERGSSPFGGGMGAPVPPPLMSAERVMAGLEATAQWLENTVTFWQDTMDLFRRTPNKFISWRAVTGNKVNATPGGDPANAHWKVPEGMALILRAEPPACEFWNIEFNNPWWETQDYRYRLTGVNIHNAALEDDGELIAVIAHQDPGLPDWLDTAGYTEGQVGRRWMFADSAPDIECTLVELSALDEHLPKTAKRITPEGRREQLGARRRGIYNRFNWM